jgi:hypothetical protein
MGNVHIERGGSQNLDAPKRQESQSRTNMIFFLSSVTIPEPTDVTKVEIHRGRISKQDKLR